MRQIPYHDNPGNACALACFTMIGQYLLPNQNITFEQLGQTADWRKNYVVWEFPVWKWLMDKGLCVTAYDPIDYNAWAKEGVSGLQKSIPKDEFTWYQNNTYNLDDVTRQIRQARDHPNFRYIHKKPTWEDVVSEYQKPGICDVVLNAQALNRKEGFVAHRVVIIEITDQEVVFNDPNFDGSGAGRRESIAHFKKVFESIQSPSLARYSPQT